MRRKSRKMRTKKRTKKRRKKRNKKRRKKRTRKRRMVDMGRGKDDEYQKYLTEMGVTTKAKLNEIKKKLTGITRHKQSKSKSRRKSNTMRRSKAIRENTTYRRSYKRM